ncbi:MAG: hypothetical protein AAFZ07_16575 [Actinomycetota bacterium]
MYLEAMTGFGATGAPPEVLAAMRAQGKPTGPGAGFAAGMPGRPDPNRPLADRGVSVEDLTNVAEALGTTGDELAADLGDDASFADIVERAKAAEVAPQDFLRAVAADLGGLGGGGGPFAGGSPFGGGTSFGSGFPPLVFDSAASSTADLLADWLGGDGDDEG